MNNKKPKLSKYYIATAKRLLKYVTETYKARFILVFVCIFLSAVASISVSLSLKYMLDDFILPLIGQKSPDYTEFYRALAVLGCIFIVGVIATFIYTRMMVYIGQGVLKRVRDDMFEHMQTLPIRYFDQNTNGSIMSLYTNDIDNIGEALNNSVANIMSSSLSFIGMIVMMVVLSPILSLITISFLALMIFIIKKIGSKSKYYFGMQQKNIGKLNGYIEEMIEGQKVIKVFCHEDKAIEDFKKYNEELRESSTGAQAFGGYMMPMLGNMYHMNYAITCCVGGLLTIAGKFDLGSLVSFLQYTKQVSNPIAQVSQQVNMILAALAGAERIF